MDEKVRVNMVLSVVHGRIPTLFERFNDSYNFIGYIRCTKISYAHIKI